MSDRSLSDLGATIDIPCYFDKKLRYVQYLVLIQFVILQNESIDIYYIFLTIRFALIFHNVLFFGHFVQLVKKIHTLRNLYILSK